VDIRVSVNVELDESEQFVTENPLRGRPDVLVTKLYLSSQLPTSDQMLASGLAVSGKEPTGFRQAHAVIKVADLPPAILEQLKERGIVQKSVGKPKRRRVSEAAKQAALG
jgi:ribosomal protein S19E (S16A)